MDKDYSRFEIRVDGNTVAAAEGNRDRAYREAMNYFRQYMADGDECEMVEVQRVIVSVSKGLE